MFIIGLFITGAIQQLCELNPGGLQRDVYDRAVYNRDVYNRPVYNRDVYNRDVYNRTVYNRSNSTIM